jgi:hypothetical protein
MLHSRGSSMTKENKDHLNILAMSIYGLLLFPLVKEMTDL